MGWVWRTRRRRSSGLDTYLVPIRQVDTDFFYLAVDVPEMAPSMPRGQERREKVRRRPATYLPMYTYRNGWIPCKSNSFSIGQDGRPRGPDLDVGSCRKLQRARPGGVTSHHAILPREAHWLPNWVKSQRTIEVGPCSCLPCSLCTLPRIINVENFRHVSNDGTLSSPDLFMVAVMGCSPGSPVGKVGKVPSVNVYDPEGCSLAVPARSTSRAAATQSSSFGLHQRPIAGRASAADIGRAPIFIFYSSVLSWAAPEQSLDPSTVLPVPAASLLVSRFARSPGHLHTLWNGNPMSDQTNLQLRGENTAPGVLPPELGRQSPEQSV